MAGAIAAAAGVDLDRVATEPGVVKEYRLAQCGQPVHAVAGHVAYVQPDVPAVQQAEFFFDPDAASAYSVLAEQIEETDDKPMERNAPLKRRRRVTGQFRQTEGSIVGRVVHAALRFWRFPDDAGLDELLRTTSLEYGVVTPDELEATIKEAVGLLARLRSDQRWEEMTAAHEGTRYRMH